MNNLEELEQKYQELGEEIEALKNKKEEYTVFGPGKAWFSGDAKVYGDEG